MYTSLILNSYPDLISGKLLNNKHSLYVFSRFTFNRFQVAAQKTFYNPLHSNFMVQEFKLNYKIKRLIPRSPQPNTTTPIVPHNSQLRTKLLTMFKSYLRLNSASQSDITIPHFSFYQFYLSHRKGGLAILNVRKLFDRWKDSYYLLFNLFYYELETVTFGSSFFKNELLAINWHAMSKFSFM